MKHGKKYLESLKKYEGATYYELAAATEMVKKLAFTKFDDTVDLSE